LHGKVPERRDLWISERERVEICRESLSHLQVSNNQHTCEQTTFYVGGSEEEPPELTHSKKQFLSPPAGGKNLICKASDRVTRRAGFV
jgi:hypothetical protein